METLTDGLLSTLEESSTIKNGDPLLKKIAQQMVSKYQIDSSNPTRRLYSSIRVLNQMNYRAHWEAHGENPHIMLDHCPYRALIENHPELCQLDQYILQTLMSAPVEQIEKNNLNLKGLPQCVFIVNKYS
jgi:predicted ArsR family transcriptional regulator